MRSLKVYNLFWSITKMQKKCNLKHENANIDDVIMTFLPRE